MRKKLIVILTIIVIIALGLIWHFRAHIFLPFIAPSVHNSIVNSKPDTSNWVLENEIYKISLRFDDSLHSVDFAIIEKSSDKEIYQAPHGFRSWDLREISIDRDNNILVQSSDIGDTLFKFVPDKTTWVEIY